MLWVAIGIVLKILVVVSIALGTVSYLIYVERKVAAYAQDRVGPNRAGKELGIPFGLLQPLADGAKMVLKEDVIPGYVSRPLYMLAPVIAIVAAMIGFAVVPFGPVGPNQISRSHPTSISASSTSSRSAAWPSMESSLPAGPRTTSTPSSALCARAPSSSATRSLWQCRSWEWS